MYYSIKNGHQFYSDELERKGHSKPGTWILVKKIKQSDYYEIVDGHHRCAIEYVIGNTYINVKIVAESYSYLQEIILKSHQIHDFEPPRTCQQPER